MIEHITLTNQDTGQTIVMDMVTTADYILERLELDPITANYSLQALPGLYGDTLNNTRFISRHLRIIGWVLPGTNASMFSTRKIALNTLFVPGQKITLTTQGKDRSDASRTIDYELEFLPDTTVRFGQSEEENNDYMCKFTIEGTCVNPFFKYKRTATNVTFSSTYSGSTNVRNYGDVPVGIEIKCKRTSSNMAYGLYFGLYGTESSPIGDLDFALGSGWLQNEDLYINTSHGEEKIVILKSNGKEQNYSSALNWSRTIWIEVPVTRGMTPREYLEFRCSATGGSGTYSAQIAVYEYYMEVVQ